LTAVAGWRVKAFNTATASDNKIHDDDIARSYGFTGGLVPGVDVYAYLTHIPVDRWGIPFLERGTISARFHRPVYDGDEVTIEAEERDGGLGLTLVDPRGEMCAMATAWLPLFSSDRPAVEEFPAEPLPSRPPPASPKLFESPPELGSLEFAFHADHAAGYLGDVGETLAVYTNERIAHPGWLLRSANYVLVANARLGPWIHVASDVRHFGLVHDGDELSTRARVINHFERKGHKFVVLDVVIVADDMRVVMRVEHTAIYEPRKQRS
jgi:acyl dehydratase